MIKRPKSASQVLNALKRPLSATTPRSILASADGQPCLLIELRRFIDCELRSCGGEKYDYSN